MCASLAILLYYPLHPYYTILSILIPSSPSLYHPLHPPYTILSILIIPSSSSVLCHPHYTILSILIIPSSSSVLCHPHYTILSMLIIPSSPSCCTVTQVTFITLNETFRQQSLVQILHYQQDTYTKISKDVWHCHQY